MKLTFLTNLKRWWRISRWRSSGKFSISMSSFTPLVAAQLNRSASRTPLHEQTRQQNQALYIMSCTHSITIHKSSNLIKMLFLKIKRVRRKKMTFLVLQAGGDGSSTAPRHGALTTFLTSWGEKKYKFSINQATICVCVCVYSTAMKMKLD